MRKVSLQSKFPGVLLFELDLYRDQRGWLCELFRHDQLPKGLYPEMCYVSMTSPGVMRGPHEHREQSDFFAFIGPGDFQVFLWNADWSEYEFYIVGESRPTAIVVPPGVIHAYRNISSNLGYVFNSPNALYAGPGKLYSVDEIRHEDSEAFEKWRLDTGILDLNSD